MRRIKEVHLPRSEAKFIISELSITSPFYGLDLMECAKFAHVRAVPP